MTGSSIKAPLVSVIMPAFNAGDTIARAIDSVLAQTYTCWELWVVDDASDDATADYVAMKAQGDERINLLRLPHNSGSPARPRNEAIACANGRYLAFLDADDAWMPRKLDTQLAAMRQADVAISCTGAELVRESGELMDIRCPPVQATYQGLLAQNTLVCSSVMLDTARLGEYSFPTVGHEDYALWLALARKGHTVLGIAENLTRYYVRAHSLSANKFKVLPYFWRIYREREGFSRWRAAYLTARYAWLARRRALKHARA
ncbi:glycosyltransferase family 2 protein [Gilvimarinus agarilyticus]|uniref:glycosyltransferase family 2 protein n=1 Tax=Gilvimarinus agarilyticus TaxID=679259 RepID=UPI0018DB5780|nr:glycosyltransferase family 2 protein [Gilvimarinus agarilyticus]